MKLVLYKTALSRGCFNRAAIIQTIAEAGDAVSSSFFWHSTVPYSKDEAKEINDQADAILDRVNGTI